MNSLARFVSILLILVPGRGARVPTASWAIVPGPSMSTPRSGHTATLLSNGKVPLAGGMVRNRAFLSSTELFDPAARTFSPGPAMRVARVGQAAAKLALRRNPDRGGLEPGRADG